MPHDLDLPALRAVIAGVRERVAKATPGPWATDCEDGLECFRVVRDTPLWRSSQGLISEPIVDQFGQVSNEAHDAELVAHAPTDLTTLADGTAALLDACERLVAENERLREALGGSSRQKLFAVLRPDGSFKGNYVCDSRAQARGYRGNGPGKVVSVRIIPAPAGKGEG